MFQNNLACEASGHLGLLLMSRMEAFYVFCLFFKLGRDKSVHILNIKSQLLNWKTELETKHRENFLKCVSVFAKYFCKCLYFVLCILY